MKPRLFIDTNVMLDLLAGREPFLYAAQQIFSLSDTKQCVAVVAAMSYATCSYILEKRMKHDDLTALLRNFSTIVEIAPIDEAVVRKSLAADSRFTDIEDAMQHYAAIHAGCTAIITRNKKDFISSNIPVYTPDEYIQSIHQGTNQ